ncbi:MAG TPA: hypothetical protein VG963_16335 [Polyangiaceae bacterium]|nr:hypothetical protein [Polyangiaceae bacterium]
MDEAAVEDLFSWWQSGSQCWGAAPTLASLCVQLGRVSDPETARFLAHQALDLTPGSFEALSLLELLTPPAQRYELCARYEAFLEDAPTHGEAPRVREQLIQLLFDYGQHDTALRYVDDALSHLNPFAADADGFEESCGLLPSDQDWTDLIEDLDELSLETGLDFNLADAAE